MFSSLAIDPATGRPFQFATPGSMAGTNNQTWFRQGSVSGDMSGLEDGAAGGADLNMFTQGAVNDAEFLRSIGYTGPSPYAFQGGPDSGGLTQAPEFQQHLDNRGLTLGSSHTVDGEFNRGRAFDAQGNPVGSEAQWRNDPDDLFGMAMLAATGFGVASVAGVGAAGAAGAGPSGGSGISGLTAGEFGELGYGAGGFGGSAAGGAGGYAYPGYQVAGDVAVAPEGFFGSGATAGGGGSAEGLNALGSGVGYTTPGLGAGGGAGMLGSLNGALGTSFTGSQLAGAGSSLVNGLIGQYSTNRASNQLRDATQQANGLQRDIYNTTRADWAPYRQAGTQALGQMSNLLANPSQVLNDPGVAFQQQQGQQQMERGAAARGNLLSGQQIKEGQRFGQDLAGTLLDRALARYGNVAQIGATGTQGSQAAGGNYANQVGANTTGLGTALGGASLYSGANWQNQLNQGIAGWNRSPYRLG